VCGHDQWSTVSPCGRNIGSSEATIPGQQEEECRLKGYYASTLDRKCRARRSIYFNAKKIMKLGTDDSCL
jgi:hypothetical protein